MIPWWAYVVATVFYGLMVIRWRRRRKGETAVIADRGRPSPGGRF